MKSDNRSNILFRYGLVVFGILLVSARIIKDLCETTIVNADKWNHKADSLMSLSQDIIPHRGNILSADGSVLATNLSYYTARIDYRAEKFNVTKLRDNIDELSEALSANFPEKSAQAWKEFLLTLITKSSLRARL